MTYLEDMLYAGKIPVQTYVMLNPNA